MCTGRADHRDCLASLCTRSNLQLTSCVDSLSASRPYGWPGPRRLLSSISQAAAMIAARHWRLSLNVAASARSTAACRYYPERQCWETCSFRNSELACMDCQTWSSRIKQDEISDVSCHCRCWRVTPFTNVLIKSKRENPHPRSYCPL